MEYNTPIVYGIDGSNPINNGNDATTYGVKWIVETQNAIYMEYGLAAIVGAVVHLVWSQVDLTP